MGPLVRTLLVRFLGKRNLGSGVRGLLGFWGAGGTEASNGTERQGKRKGNAADPCRCPAAEGAL